MAKTKTARLSLTLPNSIQVPGDAALSPTKSGFDSPRASDTPRRTQYAIAPNNEYRGDSAPSNPSQKSPFSPSQASASYPVSTNSSATPISPTLPTSPTSPTFTSLPPYPHSPQHTPKHARDPSRSFFANLKASKSSIKIQSPESTIRKVPQEPNDDMLPFRRKKSSPNLSTTPSESAPDMPPLGANGQASYYTTLNSQSSRSLTTEHGNTTDSELSSTHRPVAGSTSTRKSSFSATSEVPELKKKDSSMLSSLMKRNHSGRTEDTVNNSKPSTPTQPYPPDLGERAPAPRNRSATRNPSPHSDSGVPDAYGTSNPRLVGPQLVNQRSQVFREGGSHLFNDFKKRTVKAAGGIGKAGNRLFRNKAPDKPVEPPVNYICTVLNQSLVNQTRITRIARRLEDSKDKTEFWMPALPWRCIDYLNFKGCEIEGLYRIPGSEVQIRSWKWRFDTEHDIDLFEVEDLYDVNIIGSLFKSWLRGLPDEILPKSTQDKLSAEVGSSESAPQMLKDELSRLPPWNYYLLFAITCHLSLLHAYVDKNKMTYPNLVICFAPALQMNGDCFRWLVTDWRNCWQGCWTEKEYLEEEYRVLDHMEPVIDRGLLEPQPQISEDRSLSSSGSGTTNNTTGRPPVLDLTQGNDESRLNANGSSHHSRNPSQLPELTLPQPISPFFNSEHTH
ncbi:hypothetical protein MMC11_003538 [Xylographa trunciseda]|nr:hypothetical protein [Xylographa trunciseda]